MKLKDIFKKKEIVVDKFELYKCNKCGNDEFIIKTKLILKNNYLYETHPKFKCTKCDSVIEWI